MKSKELKELKSKKKSELVELVAKKKVELVKVTGRIYAGKEKNLKKGKNLRREIAQVMTIMNMEGEKVK